MKEFNSRFMGHNAYDIAMSCLSNNDNKENGNSLMISDMYDHEFKKHFGLPSNKK
jgi:hypothetical protein